MNTQQCSVAKKGFQPYNSRRNEPDLAADCQLPSLRDIFPGLNFTVPKLPFYEPNSEATTTHSAMVRVIIPAADEKKPYKTLKASHILFKTSKMQPRSQKALGRQANGPSEWLGVIKQKSRANQTLITYQCLFPGCDMVSKKLGNISNHFRTHDKCRPYRCHLCRDKTFTQLTNLKRHCHSLHPGQIVDLRPQVDLSLDLQCA